MRRAPGARRDPRASAVPLLAGLLLVTLAGCQATAALVSLRMPPGQGHDALEVVVIDRAGLVEGIAPSPERPEEGVVAGDRPDQVVVGWISGLCDVRTTLNVALDGTVLTIDESTTTTGGGCRMAGIFRGVVLDLGREVDPNAVRFTHGTRS